MLLTGPIQDLDGTILGKQKDDPDDDDKYAEYVTLKPGCGLTEHIMIYGATGSGKTRGFVKPFILQAMRRRESMVLVDVKGEIYEGMSQILRDDGYEVKMFNLLDKEHSDAWNCLSVIEQDKNLVQSIAEVIIKNTSNANERQDFWEKAELNLLMALMHYVATQTIPGTNQLLPIQQRSLGKSTASFPTSPSLIWSSALRRCPKAIPPCRPTAFSNWPTARFGAISPLDSETGFPCFKIRWWIRSLPTMRST